MTQSKNGPKNYAGRFFTSLAIREKLEQAGIPFILLKQDFRVVLQSSYPWRDSFCLEKVWGVFPGGYSSSQPDRATGRSFLELHNKYWVFILGGFPCGSEVKNRPADAEDVGSIPGSGKSPGEGNGNPLQSSCLKNSMNRGAWRAPVHEVAKSRAPLNK